MRMIRGGGIVILFALVLAGGGRILADAPTFDPACAHTLDVDAMATRPKASQDVYRQIRDEALADLAKRIPASSPDADEIKKLNRLMAYLWVWGDFYGEALWTRGGNLALAVGEFQGYQLMMDRRPFSADQAVKAMHDCDSFLARDEPPEFRLMATQGAIFALATFPRSNPADPSSSNRKAAARFVGVWGQDFRTLTKQGLPHPLLFQAGARMLESAKFDEPTFDLAISEIDHAFDEIDPGNPVKEELDAQFFTLDAWNARGSDTADKVTAEGWQLFADRLAAADKILEPLYAANPKEAIICELMLTVELGQGQGRDRMELWFKRGVQADPDNYDLFKAKEWYLLPRWYGSADDIQTFGQECVTAGNWPAKLPMILPVGIAECGDTGLYEDPKLWATLEIAYHEYLSRYPDATFFRTSYARHAFDSGRLDIAREQFKILGANWDKSVVSTAEYAQIKAALGP